jgi:hypothetical protein
MVDPHRGHGVAYNRWYERDHFYAVAWSGWLFAGRRWSRRGRCALRFRTMADRAAVGAGRRYVAIY